MYKTWYESYEILFTTNTIPEVSLHNIFVTDSDLWSYFSKIRSYINEEINMNALSHK